MKRLFLKVFDIREGEGLKAFLMFTFIFFLIASFLVVKPVRNSLFLVKFGVERLPYVFVLVALFSAIVASIYSKYSKKARLNHLIFATLLISIACLLIFWFLLHIGYQGDWFLYAFYVWVAIFGVITGAQFWLLANYVFNAREAKRLFGFIGSGAITGGIFGGYLTNYLATRLKTENLIFICIGFLVICLFLLWMVWKKSMGFSPKESAWRRKKESRAESSGNPLKLILKSKHLLYLAGIIGVSVVVANLVDYQFSAIASSVFTDADSLTAFFGFWLSTLNIVSLIIQLFLTGRILKHFGVAASLFFMPAGLLLGAIVILLSPALWSAILIKMSDGGFKHSINKAGTELLALPISAEIKNKTKAFIDVFIKNMAKGIGGLLLIVLTVGLHFSVAHISLIILVLIVLWTFMILRVKDEYINSFRQAIEKRTIDTEEQALNLDDASVFESFLKMLDGKSERQALYVLKLLEGTKNKELIPFLQKLIKNPSHEIKTFVLKSALVYDDLDLSSDAVDLVLSSDEKVQVEAIHYLYNRSENGMSILKDYLSHDDYRVRSAAMMCASREWRDKRDFRKEINLKAIFEKMFQSLQEKEDDPVHKRFIKIYATKIIGVARNPDLYPYLFTLAGDESLEVVQAAVINIGQTRAEEFIPVLIAHLDTKHIRRYSRESLAEYGDSIIDRLSEFLDRSHEDRRKRLSIPKVLALIGTQKSINTLMNNLHEKDLLIRFEIIKALNKLRVKFPGLRFDRQSIDERIMIEARDFTFILADLFTHQRSHLAYVETSNRDAERIQKAKKLLTGALEEKLDHNLERIFRLLGLKYIPKDMYNAYLGIKSDRSHLKANAVEFLENILDTNFKKILVPIVEAATTEIQSLRSLNISGVNIPSEVESHTRILHGDDNWLKVCALFLIAERQESRYLDMVNKLTDDPDPLVKETSIYCLKRIGD